MMVSEHAACEHEASDLKDLNEASKPKPKQEGKGRSFKLAIFGLLLLMTLVYFGGYILLLTQTQSCFGIADSGQATWGGWFSNFPQEFLSCRSLNELGDALAGAFAPVAFLWLAGAVFLQSQELAAQRQELNETQEVMRQQLDVAKAQVEETRASTELFRKQTEMAEREHQLREQAAADPEFDAMFLHLREVLYDAGGKLDLFHEGWSWGLELFNLKKMTDKELFVFVNDQFLAVQYALQEFPKLGFQTHQMSKWEELRSCLYILLQLCERASSSKKLKINLFGIDGLERVVDDVTRLLRVSCTNIRGDVYLP